MKKRNKVLGMIALMMGLIGTMVVPAAAAGTSSIAPVAASGAIPTDGTGTVVENSTDTPEKREFFTIKTAAGNVFYIVVDKQKTSDNVYLLTPVTESDLAKLTGSKTADTITGGSTVNQQQTDSAISQAPAASSQSTVSQAPKASATATAVTGAKTPPSGGNAGAVAIAALVILIVGGAGFYFKIYKPRHEVSDTEDDVEEAEEKSPDTDADTFDQSKSGEDNSDGSDSGGGNGDE